MDGWVTIGTKLDSKQLERDLKDAEKRLQQFERESERLTTAKSKVDIDLQAYEEQKRLIQESTDEMLKLSQTEEQVNNVLSMENTELTALNEKYSEQFKKVNEINKKIEENSHNQGLVKNEIQSINQKLEQTKNLSNIKGSIDNIGNSIENVVKKVGRWALAVFGIRSAYMFVRQTMSTLTQYNDQMASDVEYIRYALATALQPVIEYIIQLVYKLLSLIASVIKAIFGVNIFAKASAENFKKTKDNIQGSAKAAKELQKQLAGFDEMNILQEDGSTSTGGGGGGVAMPSFDLSDIGDTDLSALYTWTDKVKEIISDTFASIKKNVKKVMIDLGFSPEYIAAWEMTVEGIEGILNGLVDTIGGILKIIVGLFSGDTALVEEGIIQMIIGIINIIKNIPKILLGVWGQILIGLYDILIKPIIDKFSGLWDYIKVTFVGLWEYIVGKFKSVYGIFKTILSNLGTLFKTAATAIGNVIGKAFKAVVNGVLNAVETILNVPIRAINALISAINWIPGVNLGKLPTFKLPRLAKGGIINMPGQGVPVGNAIAGERGQEAVLPLTDSQQMQLLGEAIGKYITINNYITNKMNSRTISRELQITKGESDFAYNR